MAEDFAPEAVDRVRRLTRELRRTGEPAVEARRSRLLAAMGARSHVREDPEGPVLVVYPADWHRDGSVDHDRIDRVDRAVEVPLRDRGGEASWEAVDAWNARVADAVEADHGPVHGATVRAFGTYLSNHHLRRIGRASADERATFREEYFPRNAWPSQAQRAELETSLELARETADRLSRSSVDPGP